MGWDAAPVSGGRERARPASRTGATWGPAAPPARSGGRPGSAAAARCPKSCYSAPPGPEARLSPPCTAPSPGPPHPCLVTSPSSLPPLLPSRQTPRSSPPALTCSNPLAFLSERPGPSLSTIHCYSSVCSEGSCLDALSWAAISQADRRNSCLGEIAALQGQMWPLEG